MLFGTSIGNQKPGSTEGCFSDDVFSFTFKTTGFYLRLWHGTVLPYLNKRDPFIRYVSDGLYGQPQKPGLLSGDTEGCSSDVYGFQIHLQNMRVLLQITVQHGVVYLTLSLDMYLTSNGPL